jgi:hypothetical protein
MKCKCGQQQIFDQYTSIEEAIAKSPNKLPNCQGSIEHQLLAIPIKVTHQTEVLCNECNFKYIFQHVKTKTEMEIQIMTSLSTIYRRDSYIPDTNNTHCLQKSCLTCKDMNPNMYITDWKGTKLRTSKFNCKQKDVIYCITCCNCKQHYVGYTNRKLKDRMTLHRSSIKCKGTNALAKHLNTCAQPPKITINILDTSTDTQDCPLKIKEAAWIGRLSTINQGINERDETHQLLNQNTLSIISHFNHSRTCWPHFKHKMINATQDDMKRFKRVIINKEFRQRLPNEKLHTPARQRLTN